jgi:hypothetical protein
MKRAKFWTHVNGSIVKVKIKEGQTFSHWSFQYTDEGYRMAYHRFEFDGKLVKDEWETDSIDCDGRHGYGGEDCFHYMAYLIGDSVAYVDEHGNKFPHWSKLSRLPVYDQFAQMMNY